MMLTTNEAQMMSGCLIAGHRGIYGVSDLITIARGLGFTVSDEDTIVIERYTSDTEVAHESDSETVAWLADKAEEFLNEETAPEGWHFGWDDGEFFLRTATDWEME